MKSTSPVYSTVDGNGAVAHVAYATNEVIVVYPITPSTPMGESADLFAARGRTNLFGGRPTVTEMQSEAGVAGAVHGALTTGALTTTFTASQGLLLMLPNMYKIAGELTPSVFHVTARALAAHGLSIFGDHSDVMAARQTGWAMLSSASVQESHDMALIAQAATLKSRLPFVHFFDGFRTSHELQKIELLDEETMKAMLPDELIAEHRARGLSPFHPVVRGTSQNPDVFFQGREAANRFYTATPGHVQLTMQQFGDLTGRHYKLFDYVGHPLAERVVIAMGSGCETIEEVVRFRVAERGEKIGLVKVRLFRPFDTRALLDALPRSVRRIAVLDRTKEPGAAGEPLYLDVQSALYERCTGGDNPFEGLPTVVGGRYGLGSKEFSPAMVQGVFDNLAFPQPKNHFTVGIADDVSLTSLNFPEGWTLPTGEGASSALFYGLGSDGTVGAAKNTIKIIGEGTDLFAQGYFVYDSKKSGSMTVSHLRFAPEAIRRTYLVEEADFISCNAFPFVQKVPMLDQLKEGGTFLLNAPMEAAKVWGKLPADVQEALIAKKARLYTIDAYGLARELGLGGRINTFMMAAYFAISGVLPREQAEALMAKAIEKTYASKGESIVAMNLQAVRMAFEALREIVVPDKVTSTERVGIRLPDGAPEFVRRVTSEMIAGRGDRLPVSALPIDGTYPTGTTRYEKRNIATEIPRWDPESCIQCGRCAFVCPHAALRIKLIDEGVEAPEGFRSVASKGGKKLAGTRFVVQVSPEDCTGCTLCEEICPATDKEGVRAIRMEEKTNGFFEQEKINWDFFETTPAADVEGPSRGTVKGSQLCQPLFEFSGACSGCGQTPYVKLLTQLFGERLLIANATGCSSIYGGNLPTTPYTTLPDGRGPAWSNSLFEDAAEFGLGMRLTMEQRGAYARDLLTRIPFEGEAAALAAAAAAAVPSDSVLAEEQRKRVEKLKEVLADRTEPEARRLREVIDGLVPLSHWVLGGDGWAYDIGFGGLDHVLASGANVNILVLDTGVYSNTGGQASKATPRGAAAGFAALGKEGARKDLGNYAMSYGNAYVAQVALFADMAQTLKVLQEADSYEGPSLVLAYATCIAHGVDMASSITLQEQAVKTGFWPLYRYDPRHNGISNGTKGPFRLDCKPPSEDVAGFLAVQNRFKMVRRADPDRAERLLEGTRSDIARRYENFARLSGAING